MAIVVGGFAAPQARAAEDEAVGMIAELITGSDKDMQNMAIDQIRKQALGKAATVRFAGLLEKLAPEAQAKLIDALGARGDAAARPAILKMRDSKNETVRIAAAGALSALASPDDIPVLAKQAATGSDAEKTAARNTLRTLKGDKMDAAMIAALKPADAKVKVELIMALIDRHVTTAVPEIVKNATDSDPAVRIAVLAALRAMGDESYTALIVKRLNAADDRTEVRNAALALMFTCRRGRAKCADDVIAGFKGAEVTARIFLLRALTEAGGPKSLAEIVVRLKDADKAVCKVALRSLVDWPDRTATPYLKKLAEDPKNLRNHVLALRGMVRLAGRSKDQPADMAAMTTAMKLTTRNEERTMILAALGEIPTSESLALAAASLDDPALSQPACLASVVIAEKLGDKDPDLVKAVLQKVAKTAKNKELLARTKKLLEAPKK